MLRIQQLQVVQFKNYTKANYTFSKKVVGICGPNGVGKTNLLDAIYYLCFTKSYFAPSDAALVQHGARGYRVSGRFSVMDAQAEVVCILRESGKKEVSWNEEPYARMSSHVGRLPAVVIAPDDVALITGGSENRRRLIDALLCQLQPPYLQQLMEYNKLLLQRNSLLKQMAETNRRNDALLDILDEQLADRGSYIAAQRYRVLQQFLPQAAMHYHLIAGNEEQVSLGYQSQIPQHSDIEGKAAYLQLLQQARAKDLAAQRTGTGIHRDDLQLLLQHQPFKQLASQGQRKSLLFALKLTEYEWLQQHKGFAPLLLLDDVFEKLDNQRMTNLLQEVCVAKQGQVFISDTHRGRLQSQLELLDTDFEIIDIG